MLLRAFHIRIKYLKTFPDTFFLICQSICLRRVQKKKEFKGHFWTNSVCVGGGGALVVGKLHLMGFLNYLKET